MNAQCLRQWIRAVVDQRNNTTQNGLTDHPYRAGLVSKTVLSEVPMIKDVSKFGTSTMLGKSEQILDTTEPGSLAMKVNPIQNNGK